MPTRPCQPLWGAPCLQGGQLSCQKGTGKEVAEAEKLFTVVTRFFSVFLKKLDLCLCEMVRRHQTRHAAGRHRAWLCQSTHHPVPSPGFWAMGLGGWSSEASVGTAGGRECCPCTRRGSAHCCSQSLPSGWAKGSAERLGDFLPVQENSSGMKKEKNLFFFLHNSIIFSPQPHAVQAGC